MDRSCLIARPYASLVFSDIFFFLKYDLNDSARFPWSFGSSFITYPLNNNGAAGILPVYDLIEEILPEHYHQITIEKDIEKGFDYRKIRVEEK